MGGLCRRKFQSKIRLDQNVGDEEARKVVDAPEPPTGNNNDNTAVSISLNNLPKGVTTETSINVSVTSNDGAKSYRYVVIAATGTDDGTVACKEATYSDSSALSNNIAESSLAVGKHRLCVKAENAAGEAEDYPTVFEWEIVSQLPSSSPCSPCTVGCTGWAYSSWTPSQALHCSTDAVKQIAASIRTCDSQCSACSTGSTLTRTVDGTKDCSTPTCASCAAGCTAWSYGAWAPAAANTCSGTQLQQMAAGTRTCDSECSQCSTSTSKSQIVNGTKSCPKFAVLILPVFDAMVEGLRLQYREDIRSRSWCPGVSYSDNAVPTLLILTRSSYRHYIPVQERQTLNLQAPLEKGDCNEAEAQHMTRNYPIQLHLCVQKPKKCCNGPYYASADIGSVRWDTATNTCHITAKWRN